MGVKSPLFVRKQPGGMFAVVNETQTTGNIWYADSGSATGRDAAGYGQNPDAPFLTLDYAIGAATASNGDQIYLMPGHAETLTTAGAVAIDKAGLTIVGIGDGALRPTFTFTSTDNTASILITAASTKIKNILGICDDDGLTNPFHIQAADCDLDITWRDPTTLIEAAVVVLTTAAASRLKIKMKYEGQTAGSSPTSAIQLVGVAEADIDIDFYGKANVSIVDMITTLSSGVRIRGYFYNSGTTDLSKNVTANIGGCLWWAQGYDGAAGKAFSGGSAATIASDDLTAVASDVVIIQSDVKGARAGATSDMVVIKSDITGLRAGMGSDMVVMKSDLTGLRAGVNSDVAVLKAQATSDMVVIKSDVAAVKSDLVVIRAAATSDLVVLKSDVTGLRAGLGSDVVVLKSDIAGLRAGGTSDMVVMKSDLTALKSDFLIFTTKYASDNP
ncbi:MAG: hypothetical protein Q7J73_06315 [Dehalococcoidales bacterium]|nr:hypothetical protein [Dehalococcoidales bacterium]